ncbi:MAG: tetraacyldisaccharide 4'-kinase [Calditrichaeota bacterium]|nr:MAG: tetraacyldisaccharide 4'-kinase [Calditrichota bacterium]MBL1207599.1 tetraacyldisaccharide 4'-kinase [Calditrichota bacterium]NOG47432.1 tetraacyldisaccharide 4'-kinase [Calditrichota bacterium]
MIVLRLILFPISLIYGLIIQIRNLLYDIGIFKTHHFDKPIISIGNITAGGTGKTPFTIYLAEKFVDKNKKVAIVSRGYGRKSKGFHFISNGKTRFAKVIIHGDEPVLISKKLPGQIIAVCEKRKIAIDYILKNYDVDVILLDDGFQHRSVARDLDIVLVKDEKRIKNKLVLPGGLLREFKFNLKRANMIVSADDPAAIDDKNRYFSISQIDDVLDIDFKTKGSIKELAGNTCVAFAGIAHPENFHNSLKEESIVVSQFMPFKDHHSFTESDLEFLAGLCNKNKCNLLLCTEKDMVKISDLSTAKKILNDADISLLTPRLNVKVKNEKDFLNNIKYLA